MTVDGIITLDNYNAVDQWCQCLIETPFRSVLSDSWFHKWDCTIQNNLMGPILTPLFWKVDLSKVATPLNKMDWPRSLYVPYSYEKLQSDGRCRRVHIEGKWKSVISCSITVLRSCICVLSVVSPSTRSTTWQGTWTFIVRNPSNATIVLRGTVDKLNWKSTCFDTIMWNDAIPWWSVGSVHIVQRFLPDHTTWDDIGEYVWTTQ